MPDEKKPYWEFAAAIKEKYPDYKDADDLVLAQKMVEKYPEYADRVDLTAKKKSETGPLVSSSPLAGTASGSASVPGDAVSGGINYLTGQQDPSLAPKDITPREVPISPEFQTPLQSNLGEADLLRAAGTPATHVPADQETFDPMAADKARAAQGFSGDISEAFGRGVATLGAGVLKTPAFLYDVATAVTNKVINEPINAVTGGALGYMPSSEQISKKLPADNPIAALDAALRSSSEAVDKKYDKDISEYFFGDNPDYEKGLKKLAIAVSEAAPTTISLMVGNAAGLSAKASTMAGGAVFGAQKKFEVDRQVEASKRALINGDMLAPEELKVAQANANMTEIDKVANAAATGLFEGFFEQYGVTKLGGAIKDIFAKKGLQAAKDFAEKSFREVYGPIAKKYLGIAAEEPISEGLTQFSENVVDWASGLAPDTEGWGFFKGVPDAMIVGLGMGGPMAGVTGALDVMVTASNRKKAQKLSEEKKVLEDDLLSKDVSDAAKAAIVKKIRDINEMEADLFEAEKELLSNLTPEAKEEIGQLQEKAKGLADAAVDPSISEETKEILAKDLENVDKEIDKVVEKGKVEKPVDKPAKKTSKAPATKKVTEPAPQEDIDGEVAYLKAVQESFGLTNEESARLAEIEKTTAPVSQEAPAENKSSVGATPEAAPAQGAVQETTIAKPAEKPTKKSDVPMVPQSRISEVRAKEKERSDKAAAEKAAEKLDVAEIEGKLKENTQAFYGEKIDYLTYRKTKERLQEQLERVKEAVPAQEAVSSQKTGEAQHAETKTAPAETGKAPEAKQPAKEPVKESGSSVEPSVEHKKPSKTEASEKITEKPKDPEPVAAKPKKEKPKQELVDEEEQLEKEVDSKVKDSPEATKKLEDDLEVLKKMSAKDLAEKKYTAMIERAWKAKEDGKMIVKDKDGNEIDLGGISRPTYTAFRNAANDILHGKIAGKDGVKATEAKLRITAAMNKVKEKLVGQGYQKITLSTALPISPKTVADLIDMAAALARRGVNAGMDVADAVDKAVKAIKNHPLYKKLVADGSLKEKDFEDAIKQSQEKPKKKKKKKSTPPPAGQTAKNNPDTDSDGKRKKSLMARLMEAENVSRETKKKIEEFGLTYDAFSNEEASDIAKGVVNQLGIEGALNFARTSNEFPGSVRTMIYGHVINEYHAQENAAASPAEAEYATHMQGVVADELDQFLRDSGRIISAVKEFYEMSPLGIASKEIAGIQRQNAKKVTQNGLTSKKNDVVKALRGADQQAPQQKPDNTKIKEIRKKRSGLINELKQSFGNLGFAATPQNQAILMDKQIKLIAKIAATYFEEGLIRADEVIKRIKRDVRKATGVKISKEDLERVMREEVEGKPLKDHIESRGTVKPSKPVDQQIEKQKEQIKQKQLAVLNKMLPKKRNQSARERLKDHERILAAYENGAFDGAARTYENPDGEQTTETFEDLLYERYGLTNVNKPEFKKKMKQLATAVYNTPKNSSLRNQAYQNMYNYIATYQARSLAGLVGDIWYAHILSSYETHLRNLKYNSTTVALNQTALLAEKALLRGDFASFVEMMSDGLKAFVTGYYEAREILKNGAVSRFDKPGVRNDIERSRAWFLKLHKIPGRALRAADILFTLPLYEMKQRELMYDFVRNEAKEAGQKLTNAEVRAKVVEYLGRTPQRMATAQKRAEADIERVFGTNWRGNKKAVSNYHIRVSEIMEDTRPEAVKEESIQWAKRSVLTSEPRGIYKHIAHGLTLFGKVPGVKFYVPFVNVLMNITDRMIERTPIAAINVIRGKKGFGENAEALTPDEKMELTIRMINYAVGTTALFLLAGGADDDDPIVVTGRNTGDYMKDKTLQQGGKLDPYSVYVNGEKVMEYRDSPIASLFAPVGFYRDHVKYGDNDGLESGVVAATLQYLAFATELQAAKGLKDVLALFTSADQKRETPKPEKIAKNVASIAQNLYMPNLVKAVNNDVRGAFGYDDYKAENWKEALFKDVPFVEQMMNSEKYDQLGRPIKDQFKVPLIPFEKWQPVDKYYKFFTDHNFFPSYMRDDILLVGNREEDSESFKEVEMTGDQKRQLHKLRGDLIIKFLEAEADGGEGTVMSELDKIEDQKVFASQMASIFSKASKIAKTRLFNGKEVKSSLPADDDELKDMLKSIRRSVSATAREME